MGARLRGQNQLYSQADFFVREYDSPTLGVLVALVDIVALIPYLVLQFKGLGIIVEVAGYGAISSTLAIWIGAVIVAAYVDVMESFSQQPRQLSRAASVAR